MSEQGEECGELVVNIVIIAILISLLILLLMRHDEQLRDLQRRVGQLEEQVKR